MGQCFSEDAPGRPAGRQGHRAGSGPHRRKEATDWAHELGHSEDLEKAGPREELEHVQVLRLTAEDFKRATGKFSRARLLGVGPGGDVFKGTLQGRDVAVKKLSSNSQTEPDFLEEVELVSSFRHKNVVRLLAYCPEAGHRAMAFEYAPLGSLADLLHGKKGGPPPLVPLTWPQRLKILLGAAQGMEYLHYDVEGIEGGGLVHKRVKTNNVLVFPGYVGKMSDCKMQPQDQDSILLDSSLPLGNFACEAPESFTGELTQKSDVYSFGIVLLEALCGRRAMLGGPGERGPNRQQSIKEWAFTQIAAGNSRNVIDRRLDAATVPERSLQRICKLASICLDADPYRRTDMRIIVKTLSRLE